MLDWEHGIVLHTTQGNRASFAVRGKSHGFSSCGGNLRYIFEFRRGYPSKLVLVLRHPDSCLVTKDTSRVSSGHVREIQTLLELRLETHGPFLIAIVILGFLSIFKKSQASSPFEALNSTCLLRCQPDVMPPVQMRRGPR